MSLLPDARGDASALLLEHLAGPVHELPAVADPLDVADPLGDDDLHLALYLCYELHYRGLPGVDERWEWEPSLLGLRREWETMFEEGLLAAIGAPAAPGPAPDRMCPARRAVLGADEGPSLSTSPEPTGSLEQLLELAVPRSAYQPKEAAPHSGAIARLSGPPKAAL